MKIALSVENKLGIIDGSIPKPLESELCFVNAWTHNNIIICLATKLSLQDVSERILFAESAADIWADQDRFRQSNGPQIFQLRVEI